MPMVKTIVRKGFRHEGTYLQPGQALELPSIEFNHYANRGLVAEDKAKEAVDPPKQTYSRRDMRAQKVRAKVMSTQAAETEQLAPDAAVSPQPSAEEDAKDESSRL